MFGICPSFGLGRKPETTVRDLVSRFISAKPVFFRRSLLLCYQLDPNTRRANAGRCKQNKRADPINRKNAKIRKSKQQKKAGNGEIKEENKGEIQKQK